MGKSMVEPFWEKSYRDQTVSTFGTLPNRDVAEFWSTFPTHASILEVGCGEGKNALFLSARGFTVSAFDISPTAIHKLATLAARQNVRVTAWVQDLTTYNFDRDFDVIISYGTLHFVPPADWHNFIRQAREHTRPGGLHIVQIFTDRIPASPDIAPFVCGLAAEGELFSLYPDWEVLSTHSSVSTDRHPGVPEHKHASDRIVVRRPVRF
jgi:tellurite methyltransferase